MACEEIVGITWLRGLLVVDRTDEVIIDPRLHIFNTTGRFTGRFQQAGETDFEITCDDSTIEFTRNHPNGDTTRYHGKVVSFGNRAVVGVIRGRFERVTTLEDGTRTTINGDWETERPT